MAQLVQDCRKRRSFHAVNSSFKKHNYVKTYLNKMTPRGPRYWTPSESTCTWCRRVNLEGPVPSLSCLPCLACPGSGSLLTECPRLWAAPSVPWQVNVWGVMSKSPFPRSCGPSQPCPWQDSCTLGDGHGSSPSWQAVHLWLTNTSHASNDSSRN